MSVADAASGSADETTEVSWPEDHAVQVGSGAVTARGGDDHGVAVRAGDVKSTDVAHPSAKSSANCATRSGFGLAGGALRWTDTARWVSARVQAT